MNSLKGKLFEWLKEILVAGIIGNINESFSMLNSKVGEISSQLSASPQSFQPMVFNLIRSISENAIMPIAGLILTFIACYELIQLVISHNNLSNFETWIFFKWVFKTFVAVELISNTFTITLAVFDVAGHVIQQSGGLVQAGLTLDPGAMTNMQATLEAKDVGTLLGIFLQSMILNTLFQIMAILIFVIVYGRMIEIYLMVSLAPIPFATFANREQSMIGQNYLRALFALGFQGFLIMICVAIYAMLLKTVVFSEDILRSMWNALGMSVLLAFTLFRTGTLAKSVLHSH